MKIYEAGSEKPAGHMYFVYGSQGTGKTTIVKQMSGNKTLLSFDMSAGIIGKGHNTTIFEFEISDLPQIQNMVSQLVVKAIASDKVDVIVLDNVSALQNFVLENIDGASKDGRQNYQKLQLWFRKLATELRFSGKTVYATAHEVDNGPAGIDGSGRYAPDMNEKTFNAFTSMFDVVGRIYVQKGERMVDIDPETSRYSKNRLDNRTLVKASELIKTDNEEERGN